VSNFHGKERENDRNGKESAGDMRIYMRRKRSEKAVGKEEKKQQKKSMGSSCERYADKMAVHKIAALR